MSANSETCRNCDHVEPDPRRTGENVCGLSLIEALKLAYIKMLYPDDPRTIGWDQLETRLCHVLSNAMGPQAFVDWMDREHGQ